MKRFRNDINRYRNKTGMPWAALAEKAGVSPAMFTRIKKGSAVTLEAFAQLCSSFQLNPIDYMPELQTKPTKEQPSAMNRTASRPSEAYCRPSMTGIPPQRPTTHGHPCRTLTPPPCRMPSARPNRHRSGIPGLRPSQTRTPCPTRIQASTKAPCQPPDPGSECERRRTSCVTTRPERTRN